MVMLKTAITVISSIACGVLYRLGGWEHGNTKYRDLGIPAVMILTMYLLGLAASWWVMLLCFLLTFGSLTTYWKKKGEDAVWWNWLLVGVGYSFALLPYVIATGSWIGFAVKTVALGGLTMLWSETHDDVNWEEFGRGALIIATLPLLTIGG